MALEAVSKIVTGDAENAPVATKRPNYAWFRLGLGLFIVGLVIGLANGAIRDLQIYPEVYGKIVFYLFIAAGLLCLGFSMVFPSKKDVKLTGKSSGADVPDRLDTSQLSNDLLPAGHPESEIEFPENRRYTVGTVPHSVAEHTTRNLD